MTGVEDTGLTLTFCEAHAYPGCDTHCKLDPAEASLAGQEESLPVHGVTAHVIVAVL